MATSARKPWTIGGVKSALVVAFLAAVTLSGAARSAAFFDRLEGVELTGVHHMGSRFKIDTFYVNTTYGGNVGREGGGGSITCCVELPAKWRPGLMVTVRWAVSDWSQQNRDETKKGNFRSILLEGIYHARIPVEKYESAEHMYVHFFAGGKARVVSSQAGPGIYHPISEDDPHAIEQATLATRVDQLFTESELAEMRKKADAVTKRFGDWR
jgi:hypothetical protein